MAKERTSERTPRGRARERILVAALNMVADHGVDAVTHRAVATRARVSPGSTTHHFSSREDLLRESFRFYMREAEALIRSLLDEAADRGVDPLTRVRRMASAIIEREFADGGLVRAEYELLLFARADPDLAADVRAWESRIVAAVAEALESAGVDRPVMSARVVLNLVRGYELERLLDPGLTTADFEERVDPLLRSLSPSQP